MKVLPEEYRNLRLKAGVGPFATAALLLGAFLVPGMLASLETYAMAQLNARELPFWRALVAQMPGWLMYGALTPLILRASVRFPLHVAPRLPKVLAHFILALISGIAYALVAAAAYLTAMPLPDASPAFTELAVAWYLSALPLMLLTYFAVVGTGLAVHWFVQNREAELKSARLEAQLSDTRLGALRMQLHPHFLFNSLNAVTVLVRDHDNKSAERVLELLGDVLRTTLRSDSEHTIPLHEELAFIRRYLAIEEVRFSDRLRIGVDIEPGIEDALVPTLVLQPLVENAIRHGISRSGSAGRIDIIARRTGNRLVLEVVDDGPGPTSQAADARSWTTTSQGNGVGLANTRSRLAVLYGNASCELLERPGGGTIARIDIPLEASRKAIAAKVHA